MPPPRRGGAGGQKNGAAIFLRKGPGRGRSAKCFFDAHAAGSILFSPAAKAPAEGFFWRLHGRQKFFSAWLLSPGQLLPLFIPCVKDGDVMELDREELLDALRKIALSKPNDAVALALDPKNAPARDLDLWGVSEFRINSAGAVELKFIDRVKAVSLLLDCAASGEEGMSALLHALEASGE